MKTSREARFHSVDKREHSPASEEFLGASNNLLPRLKLGRVCPRFLNHGIDTV